MSTKEPQISISQASFTTFTNALQAYVTGIESILAPLKARATLEGALIAAFQAFSKEFVPVTGPIEPEPAAVDVAA